MNTHNACIRYTCNIRRYDRVSPSLRVLSWLRLNDRRTVHSLSLLFQILHTSVPSYLKTRFQHLSSYHNLDTRSQEKSLLLIPQHRTSLYSQSYTVSISRVWNSLSSHVRDCRSLPSFRSKFHEMLKSVVKSNNNNNNNDFASRSLHVSFLVDEKVPSLILQPFHHFTYVTDHSPTLPSLYLRHSSFSNPSFASPTSQALHLRHLASRP